MPFVNFLNFLILLIIMSLWGFFKFGLMIYGQEVHNTYICRWEGQWPTGRIYCRSDWWPPPGSSRLHRSPHLAHPGPVLQQIFTVTSDKCWPLPVSSRPHRSPHHAHPGLVLQQICTVASDKCWPLPGSSRLSSQVTAPRLPGPCPTTNILHSDQW